MSLEQLQTQTPPASPIQNVIQTPQYIPQTPQYTPQQLLQYQYQRELEQQNKLAEMRKEIARRQQIEQDSFIPTNVGTEITADLDSAEKIVNATTGFYNEYVKYLSLLPSKWTPTQLDSEMADSVTLKEKLKVVLDVWNEKLIKRPKENPISLNGEISLTQKDGTPINTTIQAELNSRLIKLAQILGKKVVISTEIESLTGEKDKENKKSLIEAINLGQRFLLCIIRIALTQIESLGKSKISVKTDQNGTILDLMALNLLLYLQRKILKKAPKKPVEFGQGDDALKQNYFISDPKTKSQIKNRITKNPYASFLRDSGEVAVTSSGKIKDNEFTTLPRLKFIAFCSAFGLANAITEPVGRGIAILCSMKRYPKAAIESMMFYTVGTLPLDPTNISGSKPSEIIYTFRKPSIGSFGINFNNFKKYETTNDMKDAVYNQYALVNVIEATTKSYLPTTKK